MAQARASSHWPPSCSCSRTPSTSTGSLLSWNRGPNSWLARCASSYLRPHTPRLSNNKTDKVRGEPARHRSRKLMRRHFVGSLESTSWDPERTGSQQVPSWPAVVSGGCVRRGRVLRVASPPPPPPPRAPPTYRHQRPKLPKAETVRALPGHP